MELKGLFAHYSVPFPVLVLRNSFLLVNQQQAARVAGSGWSIEQLFRPVPDLMNEYVRRVSGHRTDVSPEISEIRDIYKRMRAMATDIDPTLQAHVDALEKKACDRLESLSAKMLPHTDLGSSMSFIVTARPGTCASGSLHCRSVCFIPGYLRAYRPCRQLISDHPEYYSVYSRYGKDSLHLGSGQLMYNPTATRGAVHPGM
jgi:hypothetical protein